MTAGYELLFIGVVAVERVEPRFPKNLLQQISTYIFSLYTYKRIHAQQAQRSQHRIKSLPCNTLPSSAFLLNVATTALHHATCRNYLTTPHIYRRITRRPCHFEHVNNRAAHIGAGARASEAGPVPQPNAGHAE